ncbi:hypothetical protein [Nocardioides sp.]|uniref:hypothetical protein n=1 Tax=Nocardioides sp. TaxID=35761 RepID=UPI0039E4ACDF
MRNSGLLSRLLAAILVAAALTAALVVLVWPAARPGAEPPVRADPSSASPSASPPGPRSESTAAQVLRAWDERRAAAWAAGDAEALAGLYAEGAPAAEADLAMLAAWTARGLVVEGLTTQLLGVDVIEEEPDRLLLRVRDRVAAARATGAGVSEPLPAGPIADRDVELRRVGEEWLVASVRAIPAPVS